MGMTDQLLTSKTRILEMIAGGAPADDTLAELSRSTEAMVAGSIVGVTILDRAAQVFEHSVFPSIPGTFSQGLKGARVAERPGSCALAIYQGSTVTVEDIANDPRFQDGWKALSLEHGFAAIQSRPIRAANGASLGTLVVGFPRSRALEVREENAVEAAVHLAGLALTRRRSQRQQELLVGELQHRTRNLFSAVGAVVYSTLKAYPDAKEFRRVFDGRLSALARAHSLALDASAADLRRLLTDILAPYAHRNIVLEGPAFTLAGEAAVAFSLATHELATNAAKYGAFSNPAGLLHVGWSIARDAHGAPIFTLEWKESGGPPVSAPTRAGFGKFAIEQSLSSTVDGTVSLDFQPGGLVCTIRAPLSARLGSLTN
jgi:two-component sensor histidine kinase